MKAPSCQPVVAGPRPGRKPIFALMRHSIRLDMHRDCNTKWNDERERPYDTPINLDGIGLAEERANELRQYEIQGGLNFKIVGCSI